MAHSLFFNLIIPENTMNQYVLAYIVIVFIINIIIILAEVCFIYIVNVYT